MTSTSMYVQMYNRVNEVWDCIKISNNREQDDIHLLEEAAFDGWIFFYFILFFPLSVCFIMITYLLLGNEFVS